MNHQTRLLTMGIFAMRLLLMVQSEGLAQPDAQGLPPWDVNSDGVVNILDLVSVTSEFG